MVAGNPLSRISSKGGVVVAKKGSGGCETPPYCISSKGGVVVAKKGGGSRFEREREGGGSRKHLRLAFRAREGLWWLRRVVMGVKPLPLTFRAREGLWWLRSTVVRVSSKGWRVVVAGNPSVSCFKRGHQESGNCLNCLKYALHTLKCP